MRTALRRWAQAAPRPLVLLIDEIDTLTGDSLLSVLQQLRAGYPDRPERRPGARGRLGHVNPPCPLSLRPA